MSTARLSFHPRWTFFATLLGLTALLAVWTPFTAWGLDFGEATVSPEVQAELDKLVEQLGNPSWKIREAAGKKLVLYGMEASETLQRAAESENLTISREAKFYLPLITQGLVHSSDPEAVKEILKDYGFDSAQNLKVIHRLAELDAEQSLVPLVRILLLEHSPSLSTEAALAILWELPVPRVLHPTPSMIASEARKNNTQDGKIYESIILTHDDIPAIRQLRRQYATEILDHISARSQNNDGKALLMRLLGLELKLQKAADKPDERTQISQQTVKELVDWTGQQARYTPDVALQRLETIYCAVDILGRNDCFKQAEAMMKQIQQSRVFALQTSAFSQNNAQSENNQLTTHLDHRFRLIQRLASRGYWELACQEGDTLMKTRGISHEITISLSHSYAQMLYSAGMYWKAELIQKQFCQELEKDEDLQEMLKHEQKLQNELRARVKYYEACREGAAGRDEPQKKALRQALEFTPEEPDTLILAYRIAQADAADENWKKEVEDRINKALQHLREQLEAEGLGNKANKQNQFAWLAANTNRNLDEALACAQEAVQAEPESGGIQDTLAHVFFAMGRVKQAVETQRLAAKLLPDDLEIRRNLWRFEEALIQAEKVPSAETTQQNTENATPEAEPPQQNVETTPQNVENAAPNEANAQQNAENAVQNAESTQQNAVQNVENTPQNTETTAPGAENPQPSTNP